LLTQTREVLHTKRSAKRGRKKGGHGVKISPLLKADGKGDKLEII